MSTAEKKPVSELLPQMMKLLGERGTLLYAINTINGQEHHPELPDFMSNFTTQLFSAITAERFAQYVIDHVSELPQTEGQWALIVRSSSGRLYFPVHGDCVYVERYDQPVLESTFVTSARPVTLNDVKGVGVWDDGIMLSADNGFSKMMPGKAPCLFVLEEGKRYRVTVQEVS